MKERKDGPVIVRSWSATKQEGVINVQFVQECLRPVNSQSAMRKIFMAGHSSFGPPTETRIAWTVMTTVAYHDFGLTVGGKFPEVWEPRVIVVEFCDGDPIPKELRDLYEGQEVFYHKTWTNGGQKPKTMPGGTRVMTFNGLPIYRDTHLMIGDVQKKDYLKQHNGEM